MDRRQELIKRESDKPGFRGKVNAKCIECIYDNELAGNGTWRQQTEDCTATGCPLYSIRPTSSVSEGE